MVLGSWWEIFENGDRGSTQDFTADVVSIVVWPGEPSLEKLPNFRNGHFFNMGVSKTSRNCIFFGIEAPQGATRHEEAFKNPKGSL